MEDCTMKKMYVFAAFVAAVCLYACNKEIAAPEQNEGLVPFSFYATVDNSEGEDSKVFINTETGKVNWKSGDKLSVFDNADNYATNHVFTANTDGDAVSFDGSLNAGFENFTAIYPYSEGIVYNKDESNPIAYDIPVIQEAVKGSFDPKAARYVATGTNLSDNLSFKAAFALLKVKVDIDDVVALYVENTTRDMSGSVTISTGGGVGNGTGTRYRRITLKKSDDSVLEQGDYYIVVRFLNPDNPDQKYSNFKLTYIKEDASCLTRAASSDVLGTHVARGTVANLGSLSSFTGTPAVSWYSYYQAGYDIQIGSKTINRFTEGDATMIINASVSDAYDFRSAVSSKTGVFFFKTAGGAFTNASTISITQNLYLLNDSNTKVLFTNQNKSWNFMNGSLFLKGLSFDVSGRTGGALFSNASGVTAASDDFIMENCVFYGMTKNLYAPNSEYKGYIVHRLEAVGCSFAYNLPSTNIDMINMSAATQPYDLQYFVFKNNLVYNSTGTNTTRVTVLSMPAYVAGTYILDANITKNLMVNAVGASNGLWAFTDVASLEIKNNISYDGNSYGSNCNLFVINNTVTTISDLELSDNICIGLHSDKKWTYTNGTISTLTNVKAALPNGTNQITKSEASSVFGTLPSITDGEISYSLLPAYSTIGPQAL